MIGFKNFLTKSVWKNDGDRISSSVVAKHIDKMEDGHWGYDKAGEYRWIFRMLSLADVKRILSNSSNSFLLDYEKEEKANKRKITADSMMKYTPVIGSKSANIHDARIWDGFHRLNAAAKLNMSSIPVLVGIKK